MSPALCPTDTGSIFVQLLCSRLFMLAQRGLVLCMANTSPFQFHVYTTRHTFIAIVYPFTRRDIVYMFSPCMGCNQLGPQAKPKPDIFEVTTIQTRRGRQIKQIPIKDAEPTSSPTRSASPSKKWPLSPGVHEHDDYNKSTMDQIPKHSRTAGKVRRNVCFNW